MHKRNAQNNKDSFHKKSGGALMLRGSMEICFSFSSFFFPLFQSSVPQPPNDPRAVVAMASDPVGPLPWRKKIFLPSKPRSCGLKIMEGSPSYLPYSLPFQVPPSPPLSSLLPLTLMWVESRKNRQLSRDVLRQEVFLTWRLQKWNLKEQNVPRETAEREFKKATPISGIWTPGIT